MDVSDTIKNKLNQLEKKYASMGQNMDMYLDGLIHTDYLKYWDYIHLDVLLNLQKPRTTFPDEKIFILYHQITELHFQLILHAQTQICEKNKGSKNPEFFKEQIRRINTYWDALTQSFEIMIEGMYKDEFLKFRMALLPASGFQSAQYRMIEICSTDLINLVRYNQRKALKKSTDTKELLQNLYWKQGATELSSGKKTLTLKQFEEKYEAEFRRLAVRYKEKNIYTQFKKIEEAGNADDEMVNSLKRFDFKANIEWPLMHYKSAVRYLQKDPQDISATGGTNWQKYLPPRHQRILFFPSLWTEKELENWGKNIFSKK
ncbi:MAG: tryptophan 2,3-dioxygenase [Chitinophagaceae bacterium]|nr:MAG: tryptophan 2,3-dioxygenase [Chitinophagaceae bacterium]